MRDIPAIQICHEATFFFYSANHNPLEGWSEELGNKRERERYREKVCVGEGRARGKVVG